MRKIRTPLTAEYALSRMMEHFHPDVMGDAIERTGKHVYKMADPDQDAQLSVKQALQLDALCLAQRNFAPFADLFAKNAEVSTTPRHCETFGLRESAMLMQSAVGQFSGMIAEMKGENTTPHERQAMMLAIEQIEQRLADARRVLVEQSKPAEGVAA